MTFTLTASILAIGFALLSLGLRLFTNRDPWYWLALAGVCATLAIAGV